MHRHSQTLLLGLAIMAASAPQAAANQVARGSIELSPTVTFSHENLKREGYGGVDNFTQLTFTPTIGFCVSNHYEVGGGAIIRHQDVNGSKETSVGALASVTYNFNPSQKLVPFATLGFGALFNGGFSFSEPAVLAPSIAGGLRVLVGDAASVNFSLGYQRERNDHERQNRIVAGAGVSIFP
jgi:hypothetical protein